MRMASSWSRIRRSRQSAIWRTCIWPRASCTPPSRASSTIHRHASTVYSKIRPSRWTVSFIFRRDLAWVCKSTKRNWPSGASRSHDPRRQGTGSSLVDVPENKEVGAQDAGDIGAPGPGLDILADRDIGQRFPQVPVERFECGPARGFVSGPDIGAAQFLGLCIARPAEPVVAAAARIDRKIGQGRRHPGPADRGMEEVPAALPRGILLRPPRHHRSPLADRELDIDADLLEVVGGDVAERADARDLPGGDQHDFLALVAGLAQKRLGAGQILMAMLFRARLGAVRAAAHKKGPAFAPPFLIAKGRTRIFLLVDGKS